MRATMGKNPDLPFVVIPAKAGIHLSHCALSGGDAGV
jgi:hypothetical protein